MSEIDEGKPHLRSLLDGELYELDGEMIAGRHANCNIVLDQDDDYIVRRGEFYRES